VTAGELDPAPRSDQGPAGRLQRIRPVPVVAVLLYLVLVVSGATTSSMGIVNLRSDPAHPVGVELGAAQSIRSDEWLTITPIDLGRLATASGRADTPLATPLDLIYQLPDGSVPESIVFFDGDLLKLGAVLPQSMLFAAWWWLPTLLLVLTLPAWLMRLGSTRKLAWLATGLTVFAPAVAWWSLFPLRVLGFAVAGCYLLIHAVERWERAQRASAVAHAVAVGVLFARLPTFYVPWSITVGAPIVVATVVWLLWPRATRRHVAALIAGCAALAGVLFALVALHNHAAVDAALNTVYPGQRRSTGQAVHAAQRFAAPLLGLFAHGGAGPRSVNLSELSSAFTVTAVGALVVWLGTRRRGADRDRAATAVLGVATAGWLAWCSVPLGTLGLNVPIVNRVPPARAAQTVGFLAVFVLALVLSSAAGRVRRRIAVAAGAASGLVTLYGALSLRRLLPRLEWTYIAAVVLTVAVLIFLISRYHDRWAPIIVTVGLAAAQVVTVNPLILGFGDLRSSPAARFVRAGNERVVQRHGLWASDSIMIDALLIANGVPMLSGHQVTGPIRAQWRRLDPSGQFEYAWNRGTSYVEFRWTDSPSPVITSPGFDQVLIRVDPCALPGLGFRVAAVVADHQLAPRSCLTPSGTFRWGGRPAYAYDLTAG
jgi:hypothetical protein